MSGQNNLIQHSSANRGIMAINFRDQNQLTNSTLPVGTLTFDVVYVFLLENFRFLKKKKENFFISFFRFFNLF